MLTLAITGTGQAGPDWCCLGDRLGNPAGLDERKRSALRQQFDGSEVLSLRDEAPLEPVVLHDGVPSAGQELVPACGRAVDAIAR
ncbi:hypothetical protein D3C80_2043910 [compost metagenome]